MGGGGEESGLVTSLGSRDKALRPQSQRGQCPGSIEGNPVQDHSPCTGLPLAAPPPEKGCTRRRHAPERGPPWPCALGLQTLGGHRLQPAFDHHQGRCFPFFSYKSGEKSSGLLPVPQERSGQ